MLLDGGPRPGSSSEVLTTDVLPRQRKLIESMSTSPLVTILFPINRFLVGCSIKSIHERASALLNSLLRALQRVPRVRVERAQALLLDRAVRSQVVASQGIVLPVYSAF